MTQREWLAATERESLLEFMEERTGGRKGRLFGCACCRRFFCTPPSGADEEAERAIIEPAERFADGALAERERARIERRWSRNCEPGEPDYFKRVALVLVTQPSLSLREVWQFVSGAVFLEGHPE